MTCGPAETKRNMSYQYLLIATLGIYWSGN